MDHGVFMKSPESALGAPPLLSSPLSSFRQEELTAALASFSGFFLRPDSAPKRAFSNDLAVPLLPSDFF